MLGVASHLSHLPSPSAHTQDLGGCENWPGIHGKPQVSPPIGWNKPQRTPPHVSPKWDRILVTEQHDKSVKFTTSCPAGLSSCTYSSPSARCNSIQRGWICLQENRPGIYITNQVTRIERLMINTFYGSLHPVLVADEAHSHWYN